MSPVAGPEKRQPGVETNPPEPTPVTNLADLIRRTASENPEQVAIHCPVGAGRGDRNGYEQVTFSQLDQEIDRLAHGLVSAGFRPGEKTVLLIRPSPELFSVCFAMIRAGIVPVVVDPGLGRKRLASTIATIRPEGFIGEPLAHAARLALRLGRGTVRKTVTTGGRALGAAFTLDRIRELGASETGPFVSATDPDEVAAIAFTSGSTGTPKGVVYRHRNFTSQTGLIAQGFGFFPGETDLATMPLFCLFAVAGGVTVVVADMDFSKPADADPAKLARAIAEFEVTTLFASPALLETLSRWAEDGGRTLPSLRRVASAGAPVSPQLISRCQAMLEEPAGMMIPYGATEALPVSGIGGDEALAANSLEGRQGAGVCVGRPFDGVHVSVIKTTDSKIRVWSDDLLVEQGEIGELVVSGAHITDSYFNDQENTEKSKIRVSAAKPPLHRMGDLGYLDDQGRIWLCGRKSQRVTAADGSVHDTGRVEPVFEAHPSVYRAALVAVDTGTGSRPALCVETDSGVPVGGSEEIREELLEIGSRYPTTDGIEEILFHPAFPVDVRHNAKIEREALGAWATDELEKATTVDGRFFESSYGRIHYRREGSGSPIVFLHNGGTSLEIWSRQVEQLSRNHETFAIDLIGFGNSDKPMVDYNLELNVEILGQFIDDLAIDRPVLVGNCMGSATALRYAENNPSRVSGVFAINALAESTVDEGVFRLLSKVAKPLRSTRFSIRALPERIPVPSRFLRLLAATQFSNPGRLERRMVEERYRSPAQLRVMTSLFANIDSFSAIDRIDGMPDGFPVWTIWSRDNRVLPLESGELLMDRIGPDRREIVGGGHLAMVENHAEVTALLVEFLESTTA